jgi:hypothetical protein
MAADPYVHSAERRHVSREEQVTFDQPEELFAFVYNVNTAMDAAAVTFDETPATEEDEALDDLDALQTAPGRWLVEMECLDARWFRKVIDELRREDGSFAAFIDAIEGEAVTVDGIDEASTDLEAARAAYALHGRFMTRMLQQGDEAPVSLLQWMIDPDRGYRETLREGAWYRIILDVEQAYQPAPSYAAVPSDLTVHSVLALDANDPPPTRRNLIQWRRSGREGELLRALHRPRVDPDAGADGGTRGPQGPPLRRKGREKRSRDVYEDGASDARVPDIDDEKMEPRIGWKPDYEPMGRVAQRWIGRLLEKAVRGLRALVRWLTPPGPPMATAGAWPIALPLADLPEAEDLSVQRYVGAPSDGLVNRLPNPLNPGAPLQPFIGVMNVGQGNCNQICDNNHKVVCYYDYGSPLHNYLGTAPNVVAPCLHDDPIMVLSHWDYDHIGMVRRNPYAYQLRWIVPRQDMGSASARDVYTRILAAHGGGILLWPGQNGGPPPPHHMALPWGFIERGIVRNQLAPGSGNMNDGGLVMYVCVQDGAAGVGPGPAQPPMHAPRDAPVEDTADILAGIARGAAPTLPTQDITEAATAATEEARIALHLGVAIGGAYFAAAAVAAHNAIQAAGGAAHWGHGWNAVRLLGGPNVASLGALLIAVPGGWGAPVAGATTVIGLAALLGGAGLNAGGGAGVTHTIQVAAAAAVVDAALTRVAGGNLAQTLAAARAAVRAVLAVHVKAANPAPAPPGYPGAPAWPPGVVGWAPVVAGPGAIDLAERFVLLTGDVGIAHIPSQNAANRPRVVGMTPTHHGANTCFPTTGSQLRRVEARARLPWAPGSAAAMAGFLAGAAAQNGAFAMNVQNNVLAATVAAATAFALRELHLHGLGGGVMLAEIVTASLVAVQTGVAGNGRATLAAIAIGGAGNVSAAAAALTGNLGAGAAMSSAAAVQANVAAMTATLFGGHTVPDTVTAMIAADTAAEVLNVAFNANLEHAAIVVARHTANHGEHASTNPGIWAPNALVTPDIWPGPGVAGHYANVPSAAVRAAVAPWRAAQAASAAKRPLIVQEGVRSTTQAQSAFPLPTSGKIAYSYGITAGLAHLYVSGGYGHPHPNAILEYAARGWTDRYDTAANAHAGAQPFATAPPGLGVRGNPIALGWEGAGNPLQGGGNSTIGRAACPFCAESTYNC